MNQINLKLPVITDFSKILCKASIFYYYYIRTDQDRISPQEFLSPFRQRVTHIT